MRVIRNRPGQLAGDIADGGTVVTIGNFDGLHLGHQALVQRCHALKKPGEKVAVVTFEPLPAAFFRPEQAPSRLNAVDRKLRILRSLGVDLVWLMRFDAALAGLGAREFVQQVLVDGVDEHGAIARSSADAPEIDGQVYVLDGHHLETGDLVNVRITDSDDYDLSGHIDD